MQVWSESTDPAATTAAAVPLSLHQHKCPSLSLQPNKTDPEASSAWPTSSPSFLLIEKQQIIWKQEAHTQTAFSTLLAFAKCHFNPNTIDL